VTVQVDLSVDVVICTYDLARWDLLVRAVESVHAQSVRPGRLIICVDHNRELFERAMTTWGGDQRTTTVVVENAFAGRLGSARNTGLLRCVSDVVAFLDDDASAAPDWLARLLDVYRSQPHAMAVGGAPRPDYAAARPEWFPPDYDWVFGCHYLGLPNHREPVRHLIGANMSARLDPLLAVGGFHADNHDDMDLSHRLAHHHGPDAVVYEPKAEVHHHVSAQRLTWSYFWRRCFFVNRGKVGAFADMGEAGNLGAELRFGMRVLGNTGRGLVALLRGNRARFLQTQAAAAGLAFAVCGHVVGRIEHAFGRRTPVLTEGLRAQLVSAERSG